MVKLTHPESGFTGSVRGVEFVDGQGQVERADLVLYFRRKGFGVEHVEPAAVAEVTPDAPDPERPADDAPDEAWQLYGLRNGIPSFEVDDMTPAQIIERLGG